MITGKELIPLLGGGAPVKLSNFHLLAATVRVPLIRHGVRFKAGDVAGLSDYAIIPLVAGGASITGAALKDYLD